MWVRRYVVEVVLRKGPQGGKERRDHLHTERKIEILERVPGKRGSRVPLFRTIEGSPHLSLSRLAKRGELGGGGVSARANWV